MSTTITDTVPLEIDELPDDSWHFDRLMAFGAAAVTESGRLLSEATCLSRRSTVQIYRAGRALSFARTKLPPGQTWGASLKTHNIPRTNAWEAMQLFQRAASEEDVASLTPTEAKHKYGVTQPKTQDEEEVTPSILPFTPNTEDSDQSCVDELLPEDDDAFDADDAQGFDSDAQQDDNPEIETRDVVHTPDDSDEPPVHETESVLRLLIKVNTALRVAASMSVRDGQRDQIALEISEAYKLLDEIEVRCT